METVGWFGLGVVVLFGLLLLAMWVARKLGVGDVSAALGLPKGSIRAILGLILVVGFFVFSWSAVNSLPKAEIETLKNVSEAEVAKIPEELILSKTPSTKGEETYYDVTVLARIPDATKSIMQQVITTFGTLVVAVTGFYFGTRAVQAGRGEVTPAPLITGVSPSTGEKGSRVKATATGSNFQEDVAVKLVKAGDEIAGENVSRLRATAVEVELEIPDKDASVGSWDVVVINPDGGKGTLKKGFVVT